MKQKGNSSQKVNLDTSQISEEQINKNFVFVAATIFFANIIVGVLLQRRNLSFEIVCC